MSDYIVWIREKVGRERIFLNGAVVVVFTGKRDVLLQKRSNTENL